MAAAFVGSNFDVADYDAFVAVGLVAVAVVVAVGAAVVVVVVADGVTVAVGGRQSPYFEN